MVLEAQEARIAAVAGVVVVVAVAAVFCWQGASADSSASRSLLCGLACGNGHKPFHSAAAVAAVLLLDAFAVFLAFAVVLEASRAQFAKRSLAAVVLPCSQGVDAPRI